MARARSWACLLVASFLTACDGAREPTPGGRPPAGGGPPSKTSDPAPGGAPAFAYTATDGCSDFTVYGTNAGRTEAFVIHADMDRLGIKEGTTTFDVAKAPKGLSVGVQVFPRPQRHLHLCTDYLDPESGAPVVWEAFRGKLTVERFAPGKPPDGARPTFRVKVAIEEAAFRDPSGRTVECPHPVVLDATVGWVPG